MTFSEEILNGVMDAAAYIKTAEAQTLWASTWRGPSSAPTRWVPRTEYLWQILQCSAACKRTSKLIKLMNIAGGRVRWSSLLACHDEVRISIAHTCTSYDTANAHAFDLERDP